MKNIFLVLLVFVLLLTGCTGAKDNDSMLHTNETEGSKTKDSDTKVPSVHNTKNNLETNTKGNMKGRYVEMNLPLPKVFEKGTTMQLTKKDGQPFLYVFSYYDSITVAGYRMDEDGSWIEDTPVWLKDISFSKEGFYEPAVFWDGRGGQYLYYLVIKDYIYEGKLLYSSDGITSKEIVPKGWNEEVEGSKLNSAPKKVQVLEDGTLVALFFSGEVIFYDKDNYTIQKSILGENYGETILSTAGDSVILGQIDNRGRLMGIDIYSQPDYSKVTYPYQSNTSDFRGIYLDVNEEGEMALCDTNGIHVLEEGTSIWQTIVDGDLTSLIMETMYATGFISAENLDYYILYRSQEEYSLMKYSYDEEVDAVPSQEITIYSLKDSPTLRQAAALFRQTHPDIKINFNIVMTDEEYRTSDQEIKDDYIRALNTELLTGNGPDILVLDDLPVDSFVEKGVLVDISDIILPKINEGELYPNIMAHYKKEDKIYSVPARFIINLLCARISDGENLFTLEGLSDYMAKNQDKTLFGKMDLEDFIDTFSPYIMGRIVGEDGKLDKNKLISQLELLQSIGEQIGIVDKYTGDEKYINNELNLAGKIHLAFSQPLDFNWAMIPLGMVNLIEGSYEIFENSFISSCELGINTASKNIDLSKEFIALVLSNEIQKEDLGDGFSTNKQAVELNVEKDSGESGYGFSASVVRDDGSSNALYFEALTKEQKREFSEKFLKLSNKIRNHSPIITILKEETRELFLGNGTPEETASVIMERGNIYLSE